MKFLVLVSILVGFLSAASNLTEEEIKLQKQEEASIAAAAAKSTGTGAGVGGEGAPVHPIHEILSKLTAGLGQAVVQNENLDPKDPLKHLMGIDYMKSTGYGVLAEIDANLKKALGDSESFKNFLGAADSNDENGPLNVGKMFPPKVLNDILNGQNGGFDEDAHAAVDHELSKIFGIEKEKVTDFRTRIYNKFAEFSKDGDLSLDNLFDWETKRSLTDL